MSSRRYCYFLFVLSLLSGCASNNSSISQRAAVKEARAVEEQPAHRLSDRWILVTPFASLTRYDCSVGVPNSPHCDTFDDRFSGIYTRPIIYGESAGDVPNDSADATDIASGSDQLPYASREWLSRFFVGVHRTVTLTVKLNVGAFAATVPLVTIEHVSNKTTGETFNRVVYHRAENFPLFLIKKDGSNSIVSAQIVVRASNDSQSDAAGSALKLVQSVATLVAPPAAVLTTLTSENTKNVAAAIDQSIHQLFSTTIDEEQWLDDDIRRWGTRVSVTFRIPKAEGDWTEAPDQKIGTWTIAFANPRPSIFSDFEICPPIKSPDHPLVGCAASFSDAVAKVREQVTADQVLSFHLLGNQPNLDTIQKYLMQQEWYQKDVTAMASADASAAPFKDNVASFCRSIRSTISGLGLNATDAGIVVMAARRGLDLSNKIVTGMTGDTDNCGY